MYQKIVLVGHLGRDPEMRYTPSGSAVTHFSMATSEKFNGQDGAPQERTVWWRVSAFGKLAEIVNEYKKKGDLVLVEGQVTGDPQTGNPRLWTGQDGQPRASFEVRAQTVKFIGKGHANGQRETIDETEEVEVPL